MPVSHLLVIPMPHGYDNGVLKMSVFLAPRLREPGLLKDYAAWADWTQLCNTLPITFDVTLRYVSGAVITDRQGAHTVIPGPFGSLRPLAWRAIFGNPVTSERVSVKRASFVNRRPSTVRVVESSRVDETVDALISALAPTGGESLTKEAVLGLVPDLPDLGRRLADGLAPVGNGEVATEVPESDFHEILGMLSSHPALMRALGLVYDLEVAVSVPDPAMVWVTTNMTGALSIAETWEVPLRVELDDDGYGVASRPGAWSQGWMKLSNQAEYGVTQVAGGLGPQLVVDVAGETDASPSGTAIGVPAFADAGVSIARRLGTTFFVNMFDRHAETERATDDYINQLVEDPLEIDPPTILADDYTAGFRFDVKVVEPTETDFHSLNLRQATNGYVFPTNLLLDLDPGVDEGWVSPALITDGTAVLETEFIPNQYVELPKVVETDRGFYRAQEALTTWDGWGLSVPRPSNTTTPDGAIEVQAESAPIAEIPAKLEVSYAFVPGTLIPLRYAWTYQFRGRPVDLGGRSEDRDATAPTDALSPLVEYGRLSPISGPTILRRASKSTPGVGDLVDTIVIRSERDQLDATVERDDRVLFPPPANQSLVERHGLPAGGVGELPGAAASTYAELATRDALSLDDQVLLEPGSDEPIAGAAIVNSTVTLGPVSQDVDYLSDPMVAGYAVRGAPGQTGSAVVGTGTWPTLRSAMIELRAGSSAPVVDAANNTISVYAPKGTTTTCLVSSIPVEARLPHMKAWIRLTDEQRTAALASVLAGANEVFTPSRRLTLVHAVRVPLNPPSFSQSLVGERDTLGQTTVAIVGSVGIHRATTDRLVLTGEWTDPVDDPAEKRPGTRTRRLIIGDAPIPASGDAGRTPVAAEPELGDTKRHTVTVTGEAFCRYSRYFTEQKRVLASNGVTTTLSTLGVAAESVEVITTSGTRFQPGVDYTLDAETGIVTFLRGGIVDVRYIRRPFSRLSSEASVFRSKVVSVAASAPPAPPVVHSLVPAAKRTVARTKDELKITHDGRVVRVYLERPWYSSGEGEELAVAIDGDLLTRWGRDPLSIGAGPTTRPRASSFPLRTDDGVGVDGRFDFASHAVAFDATQGLWSGDVLVAADFGYRPWVQLHVARYQPLAVDGAHVSDPIATDPIRIGVRRQVTVARSTSGRAQVTVTGRDNVNRMKVIVQRAQSGVRDDLLQWTDVSTTDLARTGTRAASRHTGRVSVSGRGKQRLVIEDYEPVKVDGGSVRKNSLLLVYREVVEIPSNW